MDELQVKQRKLKATCLQRGVPMKNTLARATESPKGTGIGKPEDPQKTGGLQARGSVNTEGTHLLSGIPSTRQLETGQTVPGDGDPDKTQT